MLGLLVGIGAFAAHFGQFDLSAALAANLGEDGIFEDDDDEPLPLIGFDPDSPFMFSGLPLQPDQLYPAVAALRRQRLGELGPYQPGASHRDAPTR